MKTASRSGRGGASGLAAAASALLLSACSLLPFGKPKEPGEGPRPKAPLAVPPAPEGPSACAIRGEIQKLDQGLQTQSPLPAAILWRSSAYDLAWARTEAEEAPDEDDEDPEGQSRPRAVRLKTESGPLQVARLAPSAKKATGFRKLTGERTSPREIELAQNGASLAYVFEDEQGIHFIQRTPSGKPTGEAFEVKGARAPSLVAGGKTGGLWLGWADSCGQDGEIRLLKVPQKDVDLEKALSRPAPGLKCDGAGPALAASGAKLALAWLAQDPPDKRGRPGPGRLYVAFGDGAQATFGDPITVAPSESAGGGPALAFGPEGQELALAWIVDGGAVGFAILKPDGQVAVGPKLVPGSAGARGIAPGLVFDGQHYAISWESDKGAALALLNAKGEMPTAPLEFAGGGHPSTSRGALPNDYGLTFWRPEEGLIDSKALVFGRVICFAKGAKGGKKK